MNSTPKIGTVGELEFVVSQQHAIDFASADMPAVLSTPWLIWFLEHAAREAVLPLLEEQESTVGTHIEVQHLAATPLGCQVRCRSRIIGVEGPVLSFQLEANDEHERIARGLHKMRVIDVGRFAARVRAKQ